MTSLWASVADMHATDIIMRFPAKHEIAIAILSHADFKYEELCEEPVKKVVTPTQATTIGSLQDIGMSLLIPEGTVDEPVQFHIYPSTQYQINLPDRYIPASPVYFIEHERGVEFQKKITVELLHYVHLETASDCDDMVFMTSTAPTCDDFTEIKESDGIFEPRSQVGKILLSHFSPVVAARKKRAGRRGIWLIMASLFVYETLFACRS